MESLAAAPMQSAQAALEAEHQTLDREAWNLPRTPAGTAPRRVFQRGLDWEGFRDLYYRDSRRHNYEAIVAYGAYKKTTAPTTEAPSVDAWETEGGASQ
jgi:hypothetical protein